jgi:hypothetical protein
VPDSLDAQIICGRECRCSSDGEKMQLTYNGAQHASRGRHALLGAHDPRSSA